MSTSAVTQSMQKRPIWPFVIGICIMLLLAGLALFQATLYQAQVEISTTEKGWAGNIDGYPIKCGPGDFGDHLTIVMGDRSFTETNVTCSKLDNIKNALMRILIKATPASISHSRAAEVIFAFGRHMAKLLP